MWFPWFPCTRISDSDATANNPGLHCRSFSWRSREFTRNWNSWKLGWLDSTRIQSNTLVMMTSCPVICSLWPYVCSRVDASLQMLGSVPRLDMIQPNQIKEQSSQGVSKAEHPWTKQKVTKALSEFQHTCFHWLLTNVRVRTWMMPYHMSVADLPISYSSYSSLVNLSEGDVLVHSCDWRIIASIRKWIRHGRRRWSAVCIGRATWTT